MPSSERVLGSHGVSVRGGSVAGAAASSAGSPPDVAPAGAVLRGTRRQGGLASRPIPPPARAGHGGHHVPEPPPPETVDLRRRHDLAEERGYRAGQARAERELAAAIAAARALAARLGADAPAERAVVARWVTDLSLAIARRILGDAVRINATALVTIVERAISAADASPDVRILVHPRVVARLRETWEAVHGPAYLGKRWTFGADPTLPPTGCLVRYQHGLVDAGIDAQLAAVDAALRVAIDDAEAADAAEAIA